MVGSLSGVPDLFDAQYLTPQAPVPTTFRNLFDFVREDGEQNSMLACFAEFGKLMQVDPVNPHGVVFIYSRRRG
jgi:hypothetical protein